MPQQHSLYFRLVLKKGGLPEDVYLKGYAKILELTVGLAQYFVFYNVERPHQPLAYKTPDAVYLADAG